MARVIRASAFILRASGVNVIHKKVTVIRVKAREQINAVSTTIKAMVSSSKQTSKFDSVSRVEYDKRFTTNVDISKGDILEHKGVDYKIVDSELDDELVDFKIYLGVDSGKT
jgi:uncharacterized protein YdgA (DUF945 family)